MAEQPRGNQRDIDFIDTPEKWPQMVLCMKRYDGKDPGGWPSFGVMVDDAQHRYTVFEGNLGDLAAMGRAGQKLEDAAKHVYQSAAEVVADGWMVD